MLSQANKEIIATVLNVTVDELSGALSSENEVTLDLRLGGRVISQEEESRLKTTSTDAGVEIGMKKIAKAAGLDLQPGEKDAQLIADKLKTSITTTLEDKYKNMTPSEELIALQTKAQEWEQKYGKLNETYETANTKVQEWEQKYNGLQNDIIQKDINSNLLKAFPDKMKMDKDDALLIARNAFEFDNTETGIIAKRNGQIVTDPVGNPEKLENIIKSFVEEKQWIKTNGMNGSDRGANGSGLPKGMNDEQAMQYIKEAGKDPMSSEGSAMFLELTS